jgi:L-proline amide hydrolase
MSQVGPEATTEGRIPFEGYSTWYQVNGEKEDPGKLPILTLHGGPGGTHDYMEPMSALCATGRRVIFYDQLGCGRSATPPNPFLWTIQLYKEEIDVVRQALGLDSVHIVGQSWGGMLGMEYALTHPAGLASLIVADSPASIPQWVAEANRLRADLPDDVQATLLHHEQNGTTGSAEYESAVDVFYRRHVCRLDPWPDYVSRAFGNIAANPEVYHTMNGPSEFHVVGRIKDWDITDRLGDIDVPTLVISGRYDEATPAIAGAVRDGIPGSEWVLFEQSSHMPHAEEPERFVEVVDVFLTRVESGL